MIFCPGCGVQNDEGSRFCSNCGTIIERADEKPAKTVSENYGQPMNQGSPQNPQYANNIDYSEENHLYQNQPPQYMPQTQQRNQPVTYQQQQQYSGYPAPHSQQYGAYPVEDKVNPLLYLIALFFPIGILLYFANRRQKPRSARNFLTAAIIGFFLLAF
jgi:hypothetical protein